MEEIKWQKALVSLTPGGSEFVDDPEYCVKYVKEYQAFLHDFMVKTCKDKKQLEEKLRLLAQQ
jgi:hypothetical protein